MHEERTLEEIRVYYYWHKLTLLEHKFNKVMLKATDEESQSLVERGT